MANENVYVGETGAKQLYQRVKGLVSGTIPRVDGAVEGNISVLAGDGSLTDSGISGSSVGDALTKLEDVESGAQVNVIESVEVAGTALVITGKAVNIPDADVSVKGVVRLTSDPDSEAENTAATPEAIRRALASFGGFMVVRLDPVTKQPDVDSPSTKYIYLTREDPSAKTDPYTEWIWIEPEPGEPHWDVIGEASVDLSGYVQKVGGATEGNLGSLAADGGLADSGISGISVSDAVSKRHSHANGGVLDQVEEPYTTAEKNKLAGIAAGAQVNTIESISVNGTAVNPDANKNVAISIPKSVPDPSASNQMLFSTDGVTWVPMTWEMVYFNAVEIGGKVYNTVKIDNQEWMAENLDFLPEGIQLHAESPTSVDFSTAGAWYYDNNPSTAKARHYGLLYNTAAVEYLEANKATLFPGWHIPTESDMNALVGPSSSARRDSLRESVDWAGPEWFDADANNSTGFSAIPCGYIIDSNPPVFNAGGVGMELWSSTVNGANNRYFVPIKGTGTFYVNTHGNSSGFCCSIRLVKDV